MLHSARFSRLLFAATIALLGAHSSIAQEPSTDVTTQPSESRDQQIDEVVVTGEKTLRQVRQEIRAIDTRIYSLFNELNTDDDYDIVCRKRTRIGSQIVRTNCKAKLFWDAVSEHAEEGAEEDEIAILTPRPISNPDRHTEIFRAKLAELADTDDALRKALIQRKRLGEEERALQKGD